MLTHVRRATGALFPLLLWGACSSSGTPTPGEGESPELADVVYTGHANDAGLAVLLGTEAVDDPGQAAVLVDPAPGASVSGSAPATLTWTVGVSMAETVPVPAQRGPTFWQKLGRALDPVGVAHAHAHTGPMNGRAYFVTVGNTKDPGLLRVFTTDLSYTPDAAAWEELRAAESPLQVTIVNAIFEQGRIVAEGGPFQGVASTFVLGD